MGSGHSHGHAGATHRWRLQAAFGLVAVFFVVELVAALTSGSLALLSDAGHMAADVVALGAAVVATRVAGRPDRTGRRTYGSFRAEVFASGLAVLLMVGVEVIGGVVVPAIVGSSPGFVADVLAVAVPGGHAAGDLGAMQALINAMGIGFLGGSFLFGIALFRARVLARWAAALLAVGALAAVAIPLLPQVNFRLFAIPTGVALVGLGYSLWREQRTAVASRLTSPAAAQLSRAGAK